MVVIPNRESTKRILPAGPRRVFAAFEQPDRLVRWRDPNGFTNKFERFKFKPGGRWVFLMLGPSVVDYTNESIFRKTQPEIKIVIEHIVKPWCILVVTLTARGEQTHFALLASESASGRPEKYLTKGTNNDRAHREAEGQGHVSCKRDAQARGQSEQDRERRREGQGNGES